MPRWRSTASLAAMGAIFSAVTGGLINVLTASWSWLLFAIAAGLLVVVAAIAHRLEGNRKQGHATTRRVSQIAAGRGTRIAQSPIRATEADVDQIAESRGRITGSGITAENAVVRQNVREGGVIEDSPIDTR
ncbi:hypothetical protein [Herbidospora sp. RD11066]